jgi:hypothetical protein
VLERSIEFEVRGASENQPALLLISTSSMTLIRYASKLLQGMLFFPPNTARRSNLL